MKFDHLLERFTNWRLKHISDRQLLLILSIIVGLAAGVAAVVIKNSVHFIQKLLTGWFSETYENVLYIAYPAAGILIVMIFIKFILKKSIGDGVPNVLFAISKTNGLMKPHNVYSSIISSSLTVGFGGSVGLEGPTVATGAAIGSNVGRLLGLNYKQIVSLLGFASAGAMAAIFKAPITAIVFALEVIMLDLTMSSLVPLLTSSVVAALTSYFFLGQNVLYPFQINDTFHLGNVPYYIGLGIITALFSLYFIRTIAFAQKKFQKIKSWLLRFVIGGSILGLLVFIFPPLFGEGYEIINSSLNGNYFTIFDSSIFYDYRNNFAAILIMLLVLVFLKVVATSATFGAGGIGGIFAPTLFTGTHIGLLYALTINHFGLGDIPVSNFALVGMAGMISGVIHGPLTAIFLIAEITGGYHLIMPLMIVATISYGTVKIFEPDSVYTIQLSKKVHIITHHKDKALLSLLKINSLIETNFSTIHPDATLRDLVKVISESSRNIFPVVDDNNKFYGIIVMDQVRHIMFRPEHYDTTLVKNLMFMPTNTVQVDEPMEEVAQKFQHSGKYNLVVLEGDKYVGFVSRANVFSKYRELLKDISEH